MIPKPEVHHEDEHSNAIRMPEVNKAFQMSYKSKAINMNTEAQYDPQTLKKGDPPTIPEIIKEGQKSSVTFEELLAVNKIKLENSMYLIFFSPIETATLPDTKMQTLL